MTSTTSSSAKAGSLRRIARVLYSGRSAASTAGGVLDLGDDARRITFSLPLGIDHVHCYLLRADDGSWTLVDTGLGLAGAEERWSPILSRLGGPLERVVVTHFHPDHVGDARPVAELTGARVFQGRLDSEQCRRVWIERRTAAVVAEYLRANGMPTAEIPELERESAAVAALVHPVTDPEPLEPGETIAGWSVLHLPGHADGHLALLRDGVLVAGDALLARISPTVGLYPHARPDPLGDYLSSLEHVIELAPRLALPGHHEPIEDPVSRARELIEHHRERLDATLAALERGPRNAYEVSLAVFESELSPSLRRFALAESLAHLERLVFAGRAERLEDGEQILYGAAR